MENTSMDAKFKAANEINEAMVTETRALLKAILFPGGATADTVATAAYCYNQIGQGKIQILTDKIEKLCTGLGWSKHGFMEHLSNNTEAVALVQRIVHKKSDAASSEAVDQLSNYIETTIDQEQKKKEQRQKEWEALFSKKS